MKKVEEALLTALLTVLTLHVTRAQVHYKERCPNMPVIKNFDWKRYLGKWYEQERYFTLYQNFGKCWSGTYTKEHYSGKIAVRLDFVDKLLYKWNSITVDVHRKEPYYAPNRLTYTIRGVPFFEDHYEVVGTDYKSWTVEYSCRNIGIGSIRFAWILTRASHPRQSVIDEAKSRMKLLGIDIYKLERHKNNCHKKY